MIQFKNVWHHYGIRPTLRGINLTVQSGELICVMGPNAMGKSTLLAVAAGLLPCFQGYVEIDGLRRRKTMQEESDIRKKVFYLPPDPWLPSKKTGREYLVAIGQLYNVTPGQLFTHIDHVLEIFNLAQYADRNIQSYSTGQKKKISLCSALVSEAPILILDEPLSGGLDSSALHAINLILKNLSKQKETTVLMAVPVPEQVENISDRVAVIQEGKIIACDTPINLCQQHEKPNLSDTLEYILNPKDNNRAKTYVRPTEQRP